MLVWLLPSIAARILPDGLELPLRRLPEEAARVAEEDVDRLRLDVTAAEELKAGVGQHRRRAFPPVAGAVDHDHLRAELFQDVGAALRRDLRDGVDRQPGPEAVLARD